MRTDGATQTEFQTTKDDFAGDARITGPETVVELEEAACQQQWMQPTAQVRSTQNYYYLDYNQLCHNWILLDNPNEMQFIVNGGETLIYSSTTDGTVHQNGMITEWVSAQFTEEEFKQLANADSVRFKIGVTEHFQGTLGPEVRQNMQGLIERANNTTLPGS